MQIEFNQSWQFKYSILYVVMDAISYNSFTAIMQHCVVQKMLLFQDIRWCS